MPDSATFEITFANLVDDYANIAKTAMEAAPFANYNTYVEGIRYIREWKSARLEWKVRSANTTQM